MILLGFFPNRILKIQRRVPLLNLFGKYLQLGIRLFKKQKILQTLLTSFIFGPQKMMHTVQKLNTKQYFV